MEIVILALNLFRSTTSTNSRTVGGNAHTCGLRRVTCHVNLSRRTQRPCCLCLHVCAQPSLSAALIALERKMPQFEKNSIQSLTSFLSLPPSFSLSFSPTTSLQSHRTIYKSTRSQWNSSPSEEKHKVESSTVSACSRSVLTPETLHRPSG